MPVAIVLMKNKQIRFQDLYFTCILDRIAEYKLKTNQRTRVFCGLFSHCLKVLFQVKRKVASL